MTRKLHISIVCPVLFSLDAYFFFFFFFFFINELTDGKKSNNERRGTSLNVMTLTVYMNLELLERGDLPIALFLTLPHVYIINCQLQLN